MAAIAILKNPAAQIQNGIKGRGKHRRCVVPAEKGIGAGNCRCHIFFLTGRGAQDSDHHSHEQACRYALAADVANGNGEMVSISMKKS